MNQYELELKESVVPDLEKVSHQIGKWRRKWEDTFCTGIIGYGGLPRGVYQAEIIKTGELHVKEIRDSSIEFYIFDDRIKTIYSNLESLEVKSKKF